MTERERRRRVIEFLRSGSTSDAADELAASREVYPGDGTLHHVIGMDFASTGTLNQALDELEIAAKLDPGAAPILADLAQGRLARGEIEQAAEAAEKAISLSPDSTLARFTLGRAYFMAESARQARRPAPPLPGERFSRIDGRAPLYLRAVEEMEAALDAAPPFVGAIRSALALAYQRAGHDHAALAQLRARLDDPAPDMEAEQGRTRVVELENEIIRERYWEGLHPDGSSGAAQCSDTVAEDKLRLAHVYAAVGQAETALAAMAGARRAGYDARDCYVTRANDGWRLHPRLSDVHILIAGSLECVIDDELRFLPFGSIDRVRFGRYGLWRSADIDLTSGERLQALVPALYRLSAHSPNELIQTGQFAQFSYDPGETRYAHAIGARSFISEAGVLPFSEIASLAF